MQSDLKPCPFCGSKAHLFKNDRGYWATCTNEDCAAETAGRIDQHDSASLWNRRALTATLSEKQAVEVKIKPLDWRPEPPYHVARIFGNLYAVEGWDGGATLSGIGGRRDFSTVTEAKAAAFSDYKDRVLALVDVPAVEPVPFGYVYEHTVRTPGCGGSYREYRFQKTRASISDDDANEFEITETALYTSPPLSQEGEDSAEVVTLTRAEAAHIAKRLEFDASWDKCGDGYYSIKRQLGTLAATRSGSATTAKGGSDA